MKKIFILLFSISVAVSLQAQLLSQREYESIPLANILKLKNKIAEEGNSTDTSFHYLPCPPIGDQGHYNSCVAWSMGYANASILLYDTLQNWEDALRSPASATTDCRHVYPVGLQRRTTHRFSKDQNSIKL